MLSGTCLTRKSISTHVDCACCLFVLWRLTVDGRKKFWIKFFIHAEGDCLIYWVIFFVKKIPLSRRVGYVMGGWISEWISGSVDQWISERCMFVTPIRLDLPLETNQISCCKGKWYVRRFDPDTVENGHIYSSIKEEEVFIYWAYLTFSVG